MKVITIMNFVRKCDFRMEDSEEKLYRMTRQELDLVNEYQLENTFLLQYDALIEERYIRLFWENATERTELGLWFEVVKHLTDAVGAGGRHLGLACHPGGFDGVYSDREEASDR